MSINKGLHLIRAPEAWNAPTNTEDKERVGERLTGRRGLHGRCCREEK